MNADRALDEADLRALVRSFVASGIRQFSMDMGDIRVDIEMGPLPSPSITIRAPSPSGRSGPDDPAVVPNVEEDAPAGTKLLRLIEVRSPSVGILRRVNLDTGEPIAVLGDDIAEGREVCTLEVLGRRVPVVAESAGRVAEICAEDGAFVEYGQILLRLTPRAG